MARLAILLVGIGLWAQQPTGGIVGSVADASGAVVPSAEVTVTSKATSARRVVRSDADGSYAVMALPAGVYEVRAAMNGFRTTLREATVEIGGTTTVDMGLEVGQGKDVVTVEAASAQLEYERNTIDGVITREKIQELPLNGRSFLNLANLEPGVTVSPGSTSQYNSLFSVSVLGGDSGRTNITVDGGNIRNPIEGNTGMNFSQEVVQEFQLSSANFDLSTSITSVGSVNIVSRSGSNDLHGSGYFFFRDHNMSAYPALQRSTLNPDPFFARRNPGFWLGGPIKKEKLFFFFNLENISQTQVFSYLPNLPSASSLTGNYPSPYTGKQLSVKFDYTVNQNHRVFARYSHDGNHGFGPNGGATPPSNWLRNTNWSDQSVLGVSSSLRSNMVNDFRFSYQYWQNRNLFPNDSVCSGCLGLNGPQISLNGTNVTVGNTSNATQGRDLRRFQLSDTVNWQRGKHGIRFGFDMEYSPGTGFWGFCDPACLVALPPEFVRANMAAAGLSAAIPLYFPTLPTQIKTYQDILNLPFAGGVIGIGDPSQPPPYNVDQAKLNKRHHWFFQDSWRVRPRLTLNFGLAWSFESTLVNRDLSKPKYLAPLYGNDLTPTNNNYKNFSPAGGFAYQVGGSRKTVIRGGFGIYYDTEALYRRLQERAFTGPVGNGRIQFPTSGLTNTLPNIIDFGLGGRPLPVGAPLVTSGFTNMTVGQYLTLQNAQVPGITASLAPKNLNDLSVRNIDISKSGSQLYPKDYPMQRGLHFTLGFQHQFSTNAVLTVDFVRRVFLNTLLGEVDYNRWNRFVNGVRSPVIPACTGSQANVPGFNCSTGPITFWTPGGRSVYNALLVKFDKRFSKRYQFTASYAAPFQYGYNGLQNLDQWNSSWGPQGSHHILNVSGIVELPWKFQLGVISTFTAKGPMTAFVGGVDLEGDGTTSAPLPGLGINCLNRGCGKDDLAKGVDNWNSNYAGKRDALGKVIPRVVLPANYQLGKNFTSQDFRLSKLIEFGPENHRVKTTIFGEVFNAFNVANLGGFSSTLDPVQPTQTFIFGQPTSRAGQVFGSGGPRAFQLGARVQF
ncbi:MAG: carboxypeptidase regulatory-like domain-containing protein [Acidobacteria bacterium]|nr:carboxypeptidase regulatory-like domain-containing protein [Acidobacteriota bacterium]